MSVKQNVLVSIVVPTFNQGKYIEKCLRSIHQQTYKNIEVIIQDSLSNDQTEEVCRKYKSEDSRFKYIREKDEGQSDAINRGLSLSKGHYWTWICSDDYYMTVDAIEKLVETFDSLNDSKYIGVYGRAIYTDDSEKYLGDYYTYNDTDVSQKFFQRLWPFSQPASLLKTSAVRASGGVVKELNLGMDLDLFIKITQADCKFKFAPHYVAAVRVQDNSKSIKFRSQTAKNALTLIRGHFGSIGKAKQSAFFKEYVDSITDEQVRSIQKIGLVAKLFLAQKAEQEASSFETTLELGFNRHLRRFARMTIRAINFFTLGLRSKFSKI